LPTYTKKESKHLILNI